MPLAPPSLILSFEDARRVVEDHAAKLLLHGKESVSLLAAAGRVLAEIIVADRDIPPFPRSTRDGYAVRAADLVRLPVRLRVIGEIKAGAHAAEIPSKMDYGQAISIMTGAPVPSDADAVVMVEYTTPHGQSVEIARSVHSGENMVPQAAEARCGSLLLNPGSPLNPPAIALLASVGKSSLEVFLRPRVAILTTGDEIVDIDAIPGPTQIRNSNSYSLAAQIQQAGGDPVILPVAPDEPRQLRRRIEEGVQSDLLLMTGGVSMGRYDLVEQVLSEMSAEFFFTGAKIQPGRPVVFGRIPCGAGTPFGKRRAGSARGAGRQDRPAIHDAGVFPEPNVRNRAAHDATRGFVARKIQAPKGRKTNLPARTHAYFFGLPGNPISTMVTFELFARPVLEALAGMSPRKIAFLHARLKSEIRVKTGLTRFLPAVLSGEFENSQVELVPWQGSGDIAATARANCYAVIPPDRESIPAGDWVAVMIP